MTAPIGVAVIGCGLIGRRRAAVAAEHPASRLVAVCDADRAAAQAAAGPTGADVVGVWQAVLQRPDVDVVVAATPNALLADIAVAALRSGKHVLIEKPMGRDLAEARRIAAAARDAGSAHVLKVGFNHRYHPALAEARRYVAAGHVGEIINIRCRYGHGGRPGYEKEWRGSRELAGGGELTDQGVHVCDLLHWFLGEPELAFGLLQTAVWPLDGLEDNGFGLFRYPGGAIASFHTSWTQWKNLFSFEVTGRDGSLVVEGLGRSYGTESLTWHRRRPEGGAPRTERWEYPGDDGSWQAEWVEFMGAVQEGRPMHGGAADGLAAMRMLDALYRSAAAAAPVTLAA